MNDVCFIDAKVGWAVGDYGTFLKTTDGGKTWQAQHLGTSANLASVDFVDDKQRLGRAGDETGRFFHTADGGATWETQADAHSATPRPTVRSRLRERHDRLGGR